MHYDDVPVHRFVHLVILCLRVVHKVSTSLIDRGPLAMAYLDTAVKIGTLHYMVLLCLMW